MAATIRYPPRPDSCSNWLSCRYSAWLSCSWLSWARSRMTSCSSAATFGLLLPAPVPRSNNPTTGPLTTLVTRSALPNTEPPNCRRLFTGPDEPPR